MALALMSSGGKDGTLALDRARRQGLDVQWLASVFEGNTGRLRFHGVPHQLLVTQAHALGLEPVLTRTHPDTFEVAFRRLLEDLRARGCTGVLFGNVSLGDVRAGARARRRPASPPRAALGRAFHGAGVRGRGTRLSRAGGGRERRHARDAIPGSGTGRRPPHRDRDHRRPGPVRRTGGVPHVLVRRARVPHAGGIHDRESAGARGHRFLDLRPANEPPH
jgi:hypothetical protein